jgi:hypothetical protein
LVKPRFHEFDYEVLAVLGSKQEAHALEQQLIKENWDNPLILNRAVQLCFRHNGSELQKRKARHRMLTDNPMKRPENVQAARERNLGRKASEETKRKMSERHMGKSCNKRPDQSIKQVGSGNHSAKRYVFQSPTGDTHVVHGRLNKFCKELGLGYNSMNDLGLGRRQDYKGWTLQVQI